jgi:SAM-dependent methyltransferase
VYLLTFIFAFSHRVNPDTKMLSKVATYAVFPISLVLLLELWVPMIPLAILHLGVFFILAWTCHTLMVRSRPSASHLTEFYLWVAAGGVLGGAFNGFLAPIAFNGLYEYPIALALAVVLIQQREQRKGSWISDVAIGAAGALVLYGVSFIVPPILHQNAAAMGLYAVLVVACFFAIDRRLLYGILIGSLMIIGPTFKPDTAEQILRVRNFFGAKRVINHNNFHGLYHGTTLHGMQNMAITGRDEPLTYYNPNGPVGRIFKEFSGPKTKQSVAVVGLGAGTMAAYGQPGQTITYYEIDPQIIQIATDPKYFTYIADSKAKVNIVQGDARLELAKAPPGSYDIIFLDAFSSDSIPIHLLTTQAIEMYVSKLKPGGFLAFHTSNRYLDLPPVLARTAKFEKLKSIYLAMDIVSDEEEKRGWTVSRWLLMAHSYDDYGSLAHQLMWMHMDTPEDGPIWTDDFSNVLGAFSPAEG